MESYLSAEGKARFEIDRMLEAAGWAVQDARDVNLAATRGVAVREFILEPPHGRADYLLFVDRDAVGVIEAKPEGATLTGVEWQSAKYLDGLPDWVTSALEGALPFAKHLDNARKSSNGVHMWSDESMLEIGGVRRAIRSTSYRWRLA
jgi:type I restriction enzyme, R subunit